MKQNRGLLIFGQIGAFAAAHIGEKGKTAAHNAIFYAFFGAMPF